MLLNLILYGNGIGSDVMTLSPRRLSVEDHPHDSRPAFFATAGSSWPRVSVRDRFRLESRAPRRRLRAPCHWDGLLPGHPAASGATASHCTGSSTRGPL